MATPSDFYVTFGARYPREPNPVWAPAHHDGWLRICGAPDRDTAESWCWKVLLDFWSNLYDAEPDPELYPLGEIGRMVLHKTTTGDVLRVQDARDYLDRHARRLARAEVRRRTQGDSDENYRELEEAFTQWQEASSR